MTDSTHPENVHEKQGEENMKLCACGHSGEVHEEQIRMRAIDDHERGYPCTMDACPCDDWSPAP